METKDKLIEKQREYIALLKEELAKSNLNDWQERCKSLDSEIMILEGMLEVNPASKKGNLTKEEAKKMADKIRRLKGSDWGFSS